MTTREVYGLLPVWSSPFRLQPRAPTGIRSLTGRSPPDRRIPTRLAPPTGRSRRSRSLDRAGRERLTGRGTVKIQRQSDAVSVLSLRHLMALRGGKEGVGRRTVLPRFQGGRILREGSRSPLRAGWGGRWAGQTTHWWWRRGSDSGAG